MSDGQITSLGEPGTTSGGVQSGAPEKKRRRARGKGSLFKHGRTWWIAVSLRGQRIRENTYATDRRKAQEYLDAKLAKLAQARMTAVP